MRKREHAQKEKKEERGRGMLYRTNKETGREEERERERKGEEGLPLQGIATAPATSLPGITHGRITLSFIVDGEIR